MPDLRKTRICRAFTQGKCNSSDCKFAHGTEELRATGLCYKTALCTWHEKGKCASGDSCQFAHGAEELRPGGTSSDVAPRTDGQATAPQPKAKLNRRRLRQKLRRQGGAGAGGDRKAGRPDERPPDERGGSVSDDGEPPAARQGGPTSSLCYRCESTIATHLGVMVCVLCHC